MNVYTPIIPNTTNAETINIVSAGPAYGMSLSSYVLVLFPAVLLGVSGVVFPSGVSVTVLFPPVIVFPISGISS